MHFLLICKHCGRHKDRHDKKITWSRVSDFDVLDGHTTPFVACTEFQEKENQRQRMFNPDFTGPERRKMAARNLSDTIDSLVPRMRDRITPRTFDGVNRRNKK